MSTAGTEFRGSGTENQWISLDQHEQISLSPSDVASERLLTSHFACLTLLNGFTTKPYTDFVAPPQVRYDWTRLAGTRAPVVPPNRNGSVRRSRSNGKGLRGLTKWDFRFPSGTKGAVMSPTRVGQHAPKWVLVTLVHPRCFVGVSPPNFEA